MRTHARFPSVRSLALLVLAAAPAWSSAAATVTSSGSTPLYETFELTFNAPGVSGNKFRAFASVTFSKGGRTFAVDGFHDGADTWRARFMPDETGTWSYGWSFNGSSGSGTFSCTSRTNPDNRGHVKRDPARPRYLVHDDGTAHHWFGGKWISATDYGPASKGSETNAGRVSDSQFLAYLDTMKQYRHNGLLLKHALFPLENDKFSWDLAWVRRGEWLVEEMRKRGLYCQINFFDTWSRDKAKWFAYNTSGPSQVFNVWATGDEDAKRNYIRYIVARYGGFANVYWELGNEMEHSPNSGSAFVTQANASYIPWIRQHDPYDLPIGLSEGVWTAANVDIGFLHQTDSLPATSTNGNRPNVMNELVRGCSTGALWEDSTIRNSAARLCYRRTFWRMFTYGGAGCSQATWLNIKTSLNQAVLDVMGDQKRLRDFLDTIPVHWNDMVTDTGFVSAGPGSYRTRRKAGEAYVVYFLGSASAGNVTVNLPSGGYEARWYTPASGAWSAATALTSAGGSKTIAHPAFSNDLALRILKTTTTNQPPGVSLTAPANGATYTAPASIAMTATASDSDGSVAKVEFYQGSTKLGEDASSPYAFTWSNVPAGSYSLTARAIDDDGATKTSTAVSVTVSASSGGVGLSGTSPSAYAWDTLQAGKLQYIDRDFTFSSVPSAYAGLQVLRTANNDKSSTGSAFVSFTVDRAATVYVAHDDRISPKPSWLAGFADTGEALVSGAGTFSLFARDFPAGPVTLGGNIGSGTTSNSMYTVAVRPSSGSGSFTVAVQSVSTGRPYSLATAQAGALYYIDRSYTIASLSSGLNGGALIRTANDDKNVTVSSHLTLSVSGSAIVYVAYDRRATSTPSWLSGWTLTTESLAVTDSPASPLRVYSRSFAAGTITLGGNQAGGPTGAGSHYAVVVRPSSSAARTTSEASLSLVPGPLPPGEWENPGDADGDGLMDAFEAAAGVDPARVDTDGDGTPDETELDGLGRTLWDAQGAGAAAPADDDSSGGGACGLLGAELLLLALLRRRRA